jgi:signal transduction histidine kinase/ligand-binding sensor domain-containing protein
VFFRLLLACALASLLAPGASALDPRKSLTQYSRTTWTQEQGLPQDTIRAIAQTNDGYLWLGTEEGLARFDGYEFVTFDKARSGLPSNSITALAASPDGALWVGTAAGLARFDGHRVRTYTTADGLPDDSVSNLLMDRGGALWIVAGGALCRFTDGKFTAFPLGPRSPGDTVRVVGEDRRGGLWVAGVAGVGKLSDGVYTPALGGAPFSGYIITRLLTDRRGNLWIAGNQGIIQVAPSGAVRRYGVREGLPDAIVRALWEDRDGNVWAGTNGGLARAEGSRFIASNGEGAPGQDVVRCLFEDREGNFWVGADDGLTRLRDDPFTAYGKSEGLPSDEPNTVYQDRSGRILVGFRDSGLMQLTPTRRLFTERDGLPPVEVFSIRESPSGELMVSTRNGLARWDGSRFRLFAPRDALRRRTVFDGLEDADGVTWLAASAGLIEMRDGRERIVIPGGPLLADAIVALYQAPDGAIWAGSYGKGVWRVKGNERRLFTTADGLSSDQIRCLEGDSDGTFWIGTFDGGLSAFRNGRFLKFTARDGLLSDNVGAVEADGDFLWLGTTRGICRIPKRQLLDFAEHRRTALDPVNYGVEDGLRSSQCAPANPVGAGGMRTADGRVWFATSHGLAVFQNGASKGVVPVPLAHLLEMTADGRPVDLAGAARLDPGSARVQFRYSAIHLGAPERVSYSYKLDGLDKGWVRAGSRRVIDYNSLQHRRYVFRVRAELPGGEAGETSYRFEILPRFYETAWFRPLAVAALLAAGWALYQLRLRQVRSRFALVLGERARLAREIHDTLAQGFVGISSQLDAVAMCMPEEDSPARRCLDIAGRMARHSLTEARRSVMDLRASMLEEQDLGAALRAGATAWTAGTGVETEVAVEGPDTPLPEDVEHNLLRIAQEAVTNALKHAAAARIRIHLTRETRGVGLRIEDNGRGFDEKDAFSPVSGHFGVLGMRERAERLGGSMRLTSSPGQGTTVEVRAPLP